MTDEQHVVPLPVKASEQGQHELRQRRAVATRGGKMTRMKRRNRVLELRAAGLTEEQIGEQLGLTQGRVSKIITRALEDWAKKDNANADLVRQQKLFELDQLKRAIWSDALRGDLKAVNAAVKIIQVQARLSGAEAPVKIERHTTVDIEIDPGEVKRMEQAWLDSGGDVIEGTLREEID
jgi:DNA-binding CsgD family transcriptional regulator